MATIRTSARTVASSLAAPQWRPVAATVVTGVFSPSSPSSSRADRRTLSSSPHGPPHPPTSSSSFSSSDPSSSSSPSQQSPSDPSIGPLKLLHPPSHLASYFYPTALRRHYLALQSLFIELSLIPATVSSEVLGRIRYGWWREAVQACYDERNASIDFARGEVGVAAKRYKHPIVVEIEKAIWDPVVRANGGFVHAHFEAIIDAWENALSSSSTPPPLSSLEATSERIYSRQLYLQLNLLGVSSEPIDEAFSHLGKAIGILETILDVPSRLGMRLEQSARIAKNRKPSLQESQRGLTLPQEYLEAHNVVEEMIHRQGGSAPGFRDAIFDTATRANDYLITARTTLKKSLSGGRIPKDARPVLVGTATVPYLLNRLEAHDFDPFTPAFRFEAKGQGWRLPWNMYRIHWTGRI